MAFVALTGATISMRGKSGKPYALPLTKATAVGFCTFTQDGQTFWRAPEDVYVEDGYISDTINAADYLDIYLNSIVMPQMRILEKQLTNTTAVPRIMKSGWIRAGTNIALYHYSA